MMPRLRPYLTPCFWLVVPILVMNVVFTGALPAMFQPAAFNADIPWPIMLVENVLRTLMFSLTAVLPMRWNPRGWAVFLLGLALYAGSWAALIAAPASAWTGSTAGLLAPACTPAIWLAGIAMIADRPPFSQAQRRIWVTAFAALAAGFLAAHIAHTLSVISRLS